jgi:acyl-CoA thioester hydrolase
MTDPRYDFHEEDSRKLEVALDFPVQTYDIDFAGVVSNLVYHRWLEDLRLALLESYYPLEKLLVAGLAPTVIETFIRYKRPARMQDWVTGKMWVSKLSRTKFELQAIFTVNGEEAVIAEQKGCLIMMDTGRLASIPQDLLHIYEEQVLSSESTGEDG